MINKLQNCEDAKCICNKKTNNENPKCMWCGGHNPPKEGQTISLYDSHDNFITILDTVQLCFHCLTVGIQKLFFFMIDNKMFPKIIHSSCDWNKRMWPEEGCKSKQALRMNCEGKCDDQKDGQCGQ